MLKLHVFKAFFLHLVISFQPIYHSPRFCRHCRYLSGNNEESNQKEEDWRAFRAKLVQNEASSSNSASGNTWTYDTGLLIEKGSIVVSRVEDSLGCHDLRQPYFCKCVVLIVEHDNEFTQGIILNRASNLNLNDQDIVYLDDEGSQLFPDDHVADNSWRMFFGGDIAGLYEENPLILCLHNHTSEVAQSVSDMVLPGVYITSHLGARALVVEEGYPAETFFTFYGFCGWDPGQLEREVKRGSWYMVSADTRTIWGDLQLLRDPENDPRMVGLNMWQEIINAIGRQDDESFETSAFAELMLKEWATKMLMVAKDGDDLPEIEDSDIFRALKAAGQPSLKAGVLVRGSSQEESPHLLSNQFLHRSIVLLLQETDAVSVGLVLNLPSTDIYTVTMLDGINVEFPIRYGGPSGGDDEPLIWLHSKENLKNRKLGKPLGEECGIWTCTLQEIVDAIDSGLASPDDFLLVQGFCVWEKEAAGSGGITGEAMAGKFEPIPAECFDAVLSRLVLQKTISEDTISTNLESSIRAWNAGCKKNNANSMKKCRSVFQSDISICDLANDALKNWIKIFQLGNAEYY